MAQRILVVDDDREIVRLLRAYLEQARYQVFFAYDGESALHIIRRERPDLVVLDLMLPDRDGWDLTRVVRGDPSLSATDNKNNYYASGVPTNHHNGGYNALLANGSAQWWEYGTATVDDWTVWEE